MSDSDDDMSDHDNPARVRTAKRSRVSLRDSTDASGGASGSASGGASGGRAAIDEQGAAAIDEQGAASRVSLRDSADASGGASGSAHGGAGGASRGHPAIEAEIARQAALAAGNAADDESDEDGLRSAACGIIDAAKALAEENRAREAREEAARRKILAEENEASAEFTLRESNNPMSIDPMYLTVTGMDVTNMKC